MTTDRRLIAGMVGGGAGAMIGAAHRHAMWLDNQYVLAAGVFGRDTRSSRKFAHGLGVERVYDGLPRDGTGRGQTPRRRRRRRGGHPERHALRDRQRLPEEGHLGGLREAADERGDDGRRAGRRSPSPPAPSSRSPTSTRPTRWCGTPHAWSAMAISAASGSSPPNTRPDGRRPRSNSGAWTLKRRRRHGRRRRRHPRVPSAALHHRTGSHPDLGRTQHPGAGPTGVRQRHRPSHVVQRRACHGVGHHGGHRP